MTNIAFVLALLGTILLRVYYIVSKKIKEIKSYEYDLIADTSEENVKPDYSIFYKNENGNWFEGTELIRKYKPFLSNYQKELLVLKTKKEKDGASYLSEFKASLDNLTSKAVMFNFKIIGLNK